MLTDAEVKKREIINDIINNLLDREYTSKVLNIILTITEKQDKRE